MDRREALKRLGVGGALAVTAPLLLDSFNVAHAVSGVVVEPPDGPSAMAYLPATAKTNSVEIVFSTDAFGKLRQGDLSFDWEILYATPPITIDYDAAVSHVAKVTKAAGKGNMGSFTIEVRVWDDRGDPDGMVEIARYLVISDGGQIGVVSEAF